MTTFKNLNLKDIKILKLSLENLKKKDKIFSRKAVDYDNCVGKDKDGNYTFRITSLAQSVITKLSKELDYFGWIHGSCSDEEIDNLINTANEFINLTQEQ